MMRNPATDISLRGAPLECIQTGEGRPYLFLHAHLGLLSETPFVDTLARQGEVFAPSHPGFGHSPLRNGVGTIDDLAYLYLDLLDALDLDDVTLVGASMGGFIAAQMAIKNTSRISSLVLLNPVGIRVGQRDTRDIADIFAMLEPEVIAKTFADPAKGTRDYKAMPEPDVLVAARNREATARYLWSPYMHDPKLKGRLHRVTVPVLVLWGASDQLASPEYGRAFADSIPGARFELIQQAGHFPHVEKPELVASRIVDFIGSDAAPAARRA